MARGLLFAISIDRGAAAKVRTMPNNPHALTLAQNDGEIFEVMESPKSDFDLKADRPRPTGRTKRRSDVHRDRDWHRSAHVWLVDPPRQLVAVQKRSEKKDTFPGRWDISAAGHIEAGASSMDTARRELAEELGIDGVAATAFIRAFTCPAEQAGWGGCNAFEDVYFVHVDSSNCDIRAGEAEVTACRWIPIDTLEEKLRQRDSEFVPRVDAYIEAFLDYLRTNCK